MSEKYKYGGGALLLFFASLAMFDGFWKLVPVALLGLILLGVAVAPWVKQRVAKHRFPKWKAERGIPDEWSYPSQTICEMLPNAENPLVLTALYTLTARDIEDVMNSIMSGTGIESESDWAMPVRDTLVYWDREFSGTVWPKGEEMALRDALAEIGPQVTDGEGAAFAEMSQALRDSSVPPSAVASYIHAVGLENTTFALRENLPLEYAAAMFGSDGKPDSVTE